jgi:hypothetical protein
MKKVGVIRELWRYPVKSLGGERLDIAEVQKGGFVGDRLWAVRDEATCTITGAKKYPALLECTARFIEPPQAESRLDDIPPAVIGFPDGAEIASDDVRIHDALSDLAGAKVTLCALRDASDHKHYRAPRLTDSEMRRSFAVGPDDPLPDFSMLPLTKLAQLMVYATPPGTYFDAYPLHVLTTTTLESLRAKAPASDFDARRFRPNVLIQAHDGEGLPEFEWCGGKIISDNVTIHIEVPTVRCSVPSRGQRDLDADTMILKTVLQHSERCCGVYANVGRPGHLRIGGQVQLEPPRPTAVSKWAHARATTLKRLLLRATAAAIPK